MQRFSVNELLYPHGCQFIGCISDNVGHGGAGVGVIKIHVNGEDCVGDVVRENAVSFFTFSQRFFGMLALCNITVIDNNGFHHIIVCQGRADRFEDAPTTVFVTKAAFPVDRRMLRIADQGDEGFQQKFHGIRMNKFKSVGANPFLWFVTQNSFQGRIRINRFSFAV